jgi:hypothetical protein
MSIRSQIEKKIENKRQEIVELEAKLREANAFLQGLQEAMKVLPREGKEEDERSPEQILRAGSNVAKARDYLRRVGRPMHITEILKNIGLEVTKKNRVSMSGSLGSYARRGLIFTHTGPNAFGLIEFSSPHAEEEPPDDFGIEDEEKRNESRSITR